MVTLLLAATLVLCVADACWAQGRYRLDDQGQWQEVDPAPPADSPVGELRAIRQALAEGEAQEAQKLSKRWLKDYPNHPARDEALFLRGDARAADGDYFKALFHYERLIRAYPGSEFFMPALRREFEIAKKYAEGMRRKLLGMRILPAGEEAEELLIRIQERAPGSALGRRASLELADFFFRKGEMYSAAQAYDLFLTNYPQAEERQRAMRRLIEANLATFNGPKFDATGLIEAQQRLEDFRRAYPEAARQIDVDALQVRIEASLAQQILFNAEWYEKQGQRLSARYLYRRLVRDHPTTAAAREALQRLSELTGRPVDVLQQELPPDGGAEAPVAPPPLRPVPDEGGAGSPR